VNAEQRLAKNLEILSKLDVHARSCDWLTQKIHAVTAKIKLAGDSEEVRVELNTLAVRYNTEVQIFNSLEAEYIRINRQHH
jgi:phosphotransferase system HPr-like phosphotransfer protein